MNYASLALLARDLLYFICYVSGRASFPTPLTPSEEREYIQQMHDGDTDARNILIERNQRLVAHLAKKFFNSGLDPDDLISIGTIGLIKAVDNFHPSNGAQLATFASRCIENEILMSLRTAKKLKNEVYLSDPIGVDREGNEISLLDILGTEPDSIVDEVGKKLEIHSVLGLMNKALGYRERIVLELRYGLLDGVPRPQREIAKLLGISRSYVSRIERKAIDQLAEGLEQHSDTMSRLLDVKQKITALKKKKGASVNISDIEK